MLKRLAVFLMVLFICVSTVELCEAKSRRARDIDFYKTAIETARETMCKTVAGGFCSGATVAVDDPIFPLFLRVLELATDAVLPIPVDGDGLDVEALAARLATGARIGAVYTVPDFHNPSQGTLTTDRRRALVALAEQYGFYLLIDNPYRELRFAGDDQGLRPFHESDRAKIGRAHV